MTDQSGNFIPALPPQLLLESQLNISSPIVTIKANTPLYNAVGTADDVIEINGKVQRVSNIQIWHELTKQPIPTMCENQNCVSTASPSGNPFSLVGAHVVLYDPYDLAINNPPRKVRAGDKFFLVPICGSCNHTKKAIVFDHDVTAVVLIAQ